jgi:hypothetical protein
MNSRKLNVVLSSALFVGAFGVAQAVTPAPALAAPDSVAVVTGQATGGALATSWDYRKGYRDGFRDGWREARDECERPITPMTTLHSLSADDDYARGYNRGFRKGFKMGFEEYC